MTNSQLGGLCGGDGAYPLQVGICRLDLARVFHSEPYCESVASLFKYSSSHLALVVL